MRAIKQPSLSKIVQKKQEYPLSHISTTYRLDCGSFDTFIIERKGNTIYCSRYPESYIKIFPRFKYKKRLSDYYYLGRVRPLSNLARRRIPLSRKCGINRS